MVIWLFHMLFFEGCCGTVSGTVPQQLIREYSVKVFYIEICMHCQDLVIFLQLSGQNFDNFNAYCCSDLLHRAVL